MWIPERWLSTECIAAALGHPPHAIGIPLLRNPTLDRWFARAHPALPALLYLPLAIGLLVYALRRGAGASTVLVGVLSGWLAFSLAEYVVHRFYFHRPVGETRGARIDAFLTHGYHHTYLHDRTRLVMPPMVSVPLAAGLALVLLPLLGALGAALFAGVLVGYVAYDSLHYATHHVHANRGPLGFLRRYHLLHHGIGHGARFGVSSPVWDIVFGTYPRPHRRARARGRKPAPSTGGLRSHGAG